MISLRLEWSIFGVGKNRHHQSTCRAADQSISSILGVLSLCTNDAPVCVCVSFWARQLFGYDFRECRAEMTNERWMSGQTKWCIAACEYSVGIYCICSPCLPNFIPCWIFITLAEGACVCRMLLDHRTNYCYRNARESAQNGHGALCGLSESSISPTASFPRNEWFASKWQTAPCPRRSVNSLGCKIDFNSQFLYFIGFINWFDVKCEMWNFATSVADSNCL